LLSAEENFRDAEQSVIPQLFVFLSIRVIRVDSTTLRV